MSVSLTYRSLQSPFHSPLPQGFHKRTRYTIFPRLIIWPQTTIFFFVNFKYHLIFFFLFPVQIFTSLIPVTVYAWPATSPFGNISLPDVSYKTKAFATSKVEYYTLRTSTSIDDDEANKSFYVCKWLGNCLLVAKFDTTTQMFFKMLFPCRVKYILNVRLAWVRTITEQQQLWCLKTGPIHLYQTGSCKQTFSSIWVLIVCL